MYGKLIIKWLLCYTYSQSYYYYSRYGVQSSGLPYITLYEPCNFGDKVVFVFILVNKGPWSDKTLYLRKSHQNLTLEMKISYQLMYEKWYHIAIYWDKPKMHGGHLELML